MKIIFRVDGDYKIGMGHISRCISLAKYIRSVSNAKIIFITKDFEPSIAWIKQANFSLSCLGQRIDLKRDADKTLSFLGKKENSVIITDIPGIDERYLEYLRDNKNGSKLVCIDSYGIKKGIPDILINPIIVKKWYPTWKGKTETKCFFGPAYWILDESYKDYRNKVKNIKERVKDILISLGGSDTDGLTVKVISGILALNDDLRLKVVIGPAFKRGKDLISMFREFAPKKINIEEKVYNLARLMFEADIGIVSGGFTLYEAAYIGLPCLVICKVPHQLKTADKFEELGIATITGSIDKIDKFDSDVFQKKLEYLIHSQTTREKMSKNGKKLLDGKGTERVWRLIKSSLK